METKKREHIGMKNIEECGGERNTWKKEGEDKRMGRGVKTET